MTKVFLYMKLIYVTYLIWNIFKLRFTTLISLLFYANLSAALGLGDAELKSNLGEKFLAKVNISDVDSAPESSCFSASDAGDTPALKRASVSIKPHNGGYQLTISSNDVITEPIVNLRVSFHCDPNVNRDYVLLLDPAPVTANDDVSATPEESNNQPSTNIEKKKKRNSRQASNKPSVMPQEAEGQASEMSPEQLAPIKSSKKKKSKSISTVEQKLSEAYTGKSRTPELTASIQAKDSAPHQSADKPFLVISAGNSNASDGAEKPGLSLRIATEIDVNRPDESSSAQAATDTMDEVTVMTNRLAHLEKQIASLQTRNAQLVSEAQKAKQESESFNWLFWLKIALGIIAALALVEFLRRKLESRQSKQTWFDNDYADTKQDEHDELSADKYDTQSSGISVFDVDNFDTPSKQEADALSSPAQTMNFAVKEEHNSILEDADVFIEHGRPTLAIQLLQNHLIDTPTDSPAVWLKLLNLLSKEGSESEYDNAVIECNKHFNIKAAKYGSSFTADESSIEDYPHIVTRLEGVWGSPYAVGFINDLIFNKRSQPREGLNQGAFNDLFFLKIIAKNLEVGNSTTFKSSNDNLVGIQPSIAATNIANSNFNDALFTDANPIANTSIEPNSELNDIELGTKSNFNKFSDESSYEVNMLAHDETSPDLHTDTDNLTFEMPQQEANKANDNLFLAEEIHFNLPAEKVEYASEGKINKLTEEIVLDNSELPPADKDHLIEFTLDYPVEEKPKTKSKAKSAKNQADSNEIEWDLTDKNPKK